MGGLSDEYKYPKSPYLQSTMDRVDRLEDRMALADANARRPLNMPMETSIKWVKSTIPLPGYVAHRIIQMEDEIEGEASMPPVVKAPKPLEANDFKKYIGDIVHQIYDNRYVEVVGVVGDLVAVKYAPDSTPTLVEVRYLGLF
jgi:hypothetical protein